MKKFGVVTGSLALAGTLANCGLEPLKDGQESPGIPVVDSVNQCPQPILYLNTQGFEDTCGNLEDVGIFDLTEECSNPGDIVQVPPLDMDPEAIDVMTETITLVAETMGQQVVLVRPERKSYDEILIGLNSAAEQVERVGDSLKVSYAKGNAETTYGIEESDDPELRQVVKIRVTRGVRYEDPRGGTADYDCSPEEIASTVIHELGHLHGRTHTKKIMSKTVPLLSSDEGSFSESDAEAILNQQRDCGVEQMTSPSEFRRRLGFLKNLRRSLSSLLRELAQYK